MYLQPPIVHQRRGITVSSACRPSAPHRRRRLCRAAVVFVAAASAASVGNAGITTRSSGDHSCRRKLDEKELPDSRKGLTVDGNLITLGGEEGQQAEALWELQGLQVVCGNLGMPTATVQLLGPDKICRTAVGVGTGPVDAVYKAISALVQLDAELLDFSASSVTAGSSRALVSARVTIRPAGRLCGAGCMTSTTHARSTAGNADADSDASSQVQHTFSGQGADVDIVVASARAYLAALIEMIAWLRARVHEAPALAATAARSLPALAAGPALSASGLPSAS